MLEEIEKISLKFEQLKNDFENYIIDLEDILVELNNLMFRLVKLKHELKFKHIEPPKDLFELYYDIVYIINYLLPYAKEQCLDSTHEENPIYRV